MSTRRQRSLPALLGLAVLAWIARPAAAQELSAFGRWLTEDGKGVVEMYPCGAELCGKVVWQSEPLDAHGAPHTDAMNPDEKLRFRLVCELQIVGGFKRKSAAEWQDGWIYDPQSGKTYTAQLKLRDPATMDLRGYVGIPLFGETQVWTRDNRNRPSCAPR
jgi:uncharacterized protein (DUF2147 family)